jgi:outer membrane protein assembly factor BamB
MMRMMMSLALVSFVSLASAADWPQFLGLTRDSVSPEKVAVWTEKPKELWRMPVGEAHSSPVVAKGVVYAFFKPKDQDADALAAFDAKTGEKKWEKSYPRAKFSPPFGTGPRGTPLVHDGKVYTLGSTGILACWDAADGTIAWSVDTLKRFKAKNLFFGISTSPTMFQGKIAIMVGGPEAGLVGFDPKTGETAWTLGSDSASYASPLAIGKDGSESLIFLTGKNLVSVNGSGSEQWKVPFVDKLNESSTTPVQVGELIIASSVTAGSVAYKLSDLIKEPAAKPVWKADKLTCYFSTPVVVGEHLYMINGAATITNPSIVLRCVEAATGKVLWTKEKVGKYHAAIIRTADSKLLMLDDAGYLLLIEPNAKEYKELARAKVCGNTWAHPALSDGRLYVRDDKELIAVQLEAK